MPARFFLLALAVTLSACGEREPSGTLAQRAANLSTAMNVDTLYVEGEPEAVQFQEISGASFPVPFSARMPRPIRFGTPTDDEFGTAVAFKMGQAPTGSEIRVVALPESFDQIAARAEAVRLAEALGTTDGPDEMAPTWAIQSVRTSSDSHAGSVWLGEHAGRYIAVVANTALEMGDGFAPRREYLLRSWTWADDGTTLLP